MSSRKSSLAGAVLAAVCIGVYLFALVQAAVRVYLSVDRRKDAAETEFAVISRAAAAQGALGFMDEAFIETMKDALASSATLEALIISGPDNEYAFERYKDHDVIWVNNSPRFANRLGLSSRFLNQALHIQGLRNVNIRAAAGLFDYNDALQILRDTMFLIFIGLVFSIFAILLYSLPGKTDKKAHKKTQVPIFTDTEIEEEIPPHNETAAIQSLYSPRSNIGWEKNAEEKLETELRRCASAEEDMVLLVMEFIHKMDDFYYRQAAVEAAHFFKLKNLLYENGEWGITVIYPGVNLESGIGQTQRFINFLSDKFPDSPYRDGIRIGLTSRAGRLLNAERMMLEAKEALRRAKKEKDCPIIAFKSDLDKYRAFVQKRRA